MHASTHRRDDTVTLALPEGDFALCINNDVASLASGFGANDPFNRLDLRLERSLVAVGVQGHLTLFKFKRDISLSDLCSSCLSYYARPQYPGDPLWARNKLQRKCKVSSCDNCTGGRVR